MKCPNQTLNLLESKIHLLLCMCVLFYESFVCIPAYANVQFSTTIIKQNIRIILIAGVPSSQALPGFLTTAPPSVCVPEVTGALAVWIQKQKTKALSPNTLVPWNGQGRRLVELTDECYNGGNSQELRGWIKEPRCSWDTHYQFSIKTLLSPS